MDFNYFEKLTKPESDQYLIDFLNVTKEGLISMIQQFEKDKINVDFSMESITPVLLWVVKNTSLLKEKEDQSLPEWIKQSNSYKNSLYSFDEQSKIYILRASYYFGECFVKINSKLSWATGDIKSLQANMPVVKGFKKNIELPPILVTENLIRKILEGHDQSVITKAIEYWMKLV